MKTIYLANPYGFSSQQRDLLLPPIIFALTAHGLDVWEPFARNNQGSAPVDPYSIARNDLRDVRQADGFFAVVNGCPPDEGVMVELGIAIALQKPIFLFRDDFRRCSDSTEYPLNLMLFASFLPGRWREWYFESVESLYDKTRTLARWAKG